VFAVYSGSWPVERGGGGSFPWPHDVQGASPSTKNTEKGIPGRSFASSKNVGTHIYGERVEREPITRVWGESPQRGPGAEPLVRGSGGEAPLFSLWMPNGSSKFASFSVFCKIYNPRYL